MVNSLWHSLILFLLLFYPFAQHAQKKIIPYSQAVNEVVNASNAVIIDRIGKKSFDEWIDSIVVKSIPFNNGCNGSHYPCDPVPPRLSDIGRISITYYTTIPGFGRYVNSNFAYQASKNKMAFEDHSIFPDCIKYPFKGKFLTRDSLFSIAKGVLMTSDTSQFINKYSCFNAGNFAFLFQTGQATLILSANNGEVLSYRYFGSISSCNGFVQKCYLKPDWLILAKQFLKLSDDDTLKQMSNVTKQYGEYGCSWQFGSQKALLVINGKDGTILEYTNYYGPADNFKGTSKLLILPKIIKDSLILTKPEQESEEPGCDYDEYHPVTGSDKQCYLNKCWADRKGVKIIKEGCSKENYKSNEIYTWPIGTICDRGSMGLRWDDGYPVSLNDGTLLFKRGNEELRAVYKGHCK